MEATVGKHAPQLSSLLLSWSWTRRWRSTWNGLYFSGRNNRYLVLKIIAPAGIRISNPYFFFKGPRFYPCFRHIHFSFLLQNGIFFGLPYPHTIGGWNHYSLLRKRQDHPMIIYLCRPANPMPNIVFSHSIFWDAPIDDLAVERI